jgi:hypothetical protein
MLSKVKLSSFGECLLDSLSSVINRSLGCFAFILYGHGDALNLEASTDFS